MSFVGIKTEVWRGRKWNNYILFQLRYLSSHSISSHFSINPSCCNFTENFTEFHQNFNFNFDMLKVLKKWSYLPTNRLICVFLFSRFYSYHLKHITAHFKNSVMVIRMRNTNIKLSRKSCILLFSVHKNWSVHAAGNTRRRDNNGKVYSLDQWEIISLSES